MRSLAALAYDLDHPDRDHRAAAADELARRGQPAVLPLCEVLRTGTALQRCAAADVLVRLGDRRASAPLLGLLEYPDGAVRRHAAAALRVLGDAEAVAPLAVCVKSGPPEAAMEAVAALGKLGIQGASEAAHALVEALDSPEPGVALAALAALTGWAGAVPSAALREAMPVLRRKRGRRNRLRSDLQRACWSAYQVIDAATSALKDLPLPARTLDPADSLPVPAAAAGPEPAGLPIAAREPEAGG